MKTNNNKETKKIPKESVLRKDIYQANPLINARKGMDITELRIFALGLQALNPHRSNNDKFYDEEFPRTFIPSGRIAEIFGNTKYLHDLKKICDKLFESHITLNYSDGGFKLLHVFQELEYVPKEGLYIQFDNKMKPYILDLFQSKGYTKINVEQIFPLMSAYAVRLVELLLQFQGTKQKKLSRKIDIEDLRFALNVPDDAYADRMDNFKKFVIDEPLREINQKTEYEMSYSVIKSGRKVTGFEFYMDISKALESERINALKENSNIDMTSGNAIKYIMRYGITEKLARELWNLCNDNDDFIKRLTYAEEELEKQADSVTNKQGFIVKAVKENWYEKNFDRKCKEIAKKNSEGSALLNDSWLKLMKILHTYNSYEIRVKFGVLRMLTESEINIVRNDLLNGGFSPKTKQMLLNIGWDFGLAVDVFSFNNNN